MDGGVVEQKRAVFISADATLKPVDGVGRECAPVCVCMFAVLLTASVWALNRKEPAGRSVLTQASCQCLIFIIFHLSLSQREKDGIKSQARAQQIQLRGGRYVKKTEKC